MSSIKNVALAGATGSLGSLVVKHVIASGLFNVTILKRAGSTTTYPDSADVKFVEVDYDSQESLQAALTGQDAVISTLPDRAIESQIPLIDAAVTTGVKRFLPSMFGCDLTNPNARKIPVFVPKAKIEDYLKSKAKESGLTYTFIYTGAFLDWGIQKKFLVDLSSSTPRVIDGGDLTFSTTSLSTIADAIVGVLSHPAETENRALRVHDLVTTQNKILALAREAHPTKKWDPVSVSLDQLTAAAEANIAQGIFDHETVVAFLYRGLLDPAYETTFKTTDNKLLGIKSKGEDFIVKTVKDLLN
ncbi:oxidoreductase [Colletotrichum truncatum]|uniref:Oxidoreductase n=1 Tax=Colletotrichum truncatum TaxID=5467 RepID=A0ACC3YNY9_COLTU|nr:oxidoreductase [Colletotrichum truncatum]KAF6781154.1 oxidoreductase [Colletotrichum truncatum]